MLEATRFKHGLAFQSDGTNCVDDGVMSEEEGH